MKHSIPRRRPSSRRARARLNRARRAVSSPLYRAQALFFTACGGIALALLATPMGRNILTAAVAAAEPLRTAIIAALAVLLGAAFVATITITLHHLSQISTEARRPAR